MGQIYWETFSWEAFATLAAGSGAVLAALIVGLRQVGVADRQARILGQQVKLADLSLRNSLFDRRWAVYEATRECLGEITRTGRPPEPDTERAFLIAKNQADFLFGPHVRDVLTDFWGRLCEFGAVHSMMTNSYATTGHYSQENVVKKRDFMIWTADLQMRLNKIFSDLNLHHHE